MSKRIRLCTRLAAVSAACFVLGVQDALSQQRPAAPAQPSAAASGVRIRKMPKPGKALLQRTPEYQNNVARALSGSRPRRDWAVIDVIYDTAPEWVDELTFSFFALAEGRNDQGQKEFSLYRGQATYVDIRRGEHVATMIISPVAVERYGDIVAVAVEVAVGGKVVAEGTEVAISGVPQDWWRNSRVIDSPTVIKRDAYMTERSKTPFALANIDDYEVVK